MKLLQGILSWNKKMHASTTQKDLITLIHNGLFTKLSFCATSAKILFFVTNAGLADSPQWRLGQMLLPTSVHLVLLIGALLYDAVYPTGTNSIYTVWLIDKKEAHRCFCQLGTKHQCKSTGVYSSHTSYVLPICKCMGTSTLVNETEVANYTKLSMWTMVYCD